MTIPISYNIRNLLAKKGSTVMTALGIAAPVAVLMALLALVNGLQSSLTATGHPAHILVMRKGATSELTSTLSRQAYRDLRFVPGLAKSSAGEPMASLEMVTVIMLESPSIPDGINITVRGLLPIGFEMREGLKIVEGRTFHPGSRELVVGRGVANRYPMARPGSTLKFGRGEWTVVGVFDAGRSAANSEIFADLDQVGAEYNRAEDLCSMLVRVADASAIPAVQKALTSDKRHSVIAQTETEYYAAQTSSARPLQVMGFFISGIMAIGAAFAAMNTMYAAASRRTAEIGTLRAIGFSRRDVMASFMVESLLLSFIGGVVGCLMALPFNGFETGIGSFVTFSEITFDFRIGPVTMLSGIAFALVIGLLGGFFPARSAARKKIVDALRAQ
jgi:putative ABC transport system permease protein